MAPVAVAVAVDIPDLSLSSLELDARSSTPLDSPADTLSSLVKRDKDGGPVLSPSETFELLTARDTTATTTATINPASGSINPNDINMKAIQAVFAIIGASFVIGAIWFFFWAKNGGFQWKENDWEEYKSTVLRRKGPNGTTLSNATKSTKLGGGSVVGQGFSDDGSMSWEGTNTVTDLSSEAPVIKEKRSSRRAKRENAKAAKIREVKEERWEGGHDEDVRAYRQERPARVGGMNKSSDSQYYGTDYAASDRQDTYSQSHHSSWNSSAAPPPPQYSSRNTSPEKRQSRRDFSYTTDDHFSTTSQSSPPKHANHHNHNKPNRYHSPDKSARPSRAPPSSYDQDADYYSDLQSQNTKSYHHPLPSVSGNKNNHGRSKAGGGVTGGYRRNRRDSLDD